MCLQKIIKLFGRLLHTTVMLPCFLIEMLFLKVVYLKMDSSIINLKCWHCGTELIWGGDHDLDDDEIMIL